MPPERVVVPGPVPGAGVRGCPGAPPPSWGLSITVSPPPLVSLVAAALLLLVGGVPIVVAASTYHGYCY